MSTTTVISNTLAQALYKSDPNTLADTLRQYGIGTHLSPQKWAWLGTTGATAVAINTAAFFTNASPGAYTPALPQSQSVLAPALIVGTLRVTTGPSGSVGAYLVTDSGGTTQLKANTGVSGAAVLSQPGVALLSDDGTTITFPAQVSGFIIEYLPRSFTDVTTVVSGV